MGIDVKQQARGENGTDRSSRDGGLLRAAYPF